MAVVLLSNDLMIGSRIHAAADAAGVELLTVATPRDLPDPETVRLLFVDWSARTDGWGQAIAAWREGHPARVVLYGPHVDLEAHAAARDAGLGPMWARSRLVAELPKLVGSAAG